MEAITSKRENKEKTWSRGANSRLPFGLNTNLNLSKSPLTRLRRPRGSHSGRDKWPDESFQALLLRRFSQRDRLPLGHRWMSQFSSNSICTFSPDNYAEFLSCKTFMENRSSGVENCEIFVSFVG